MSTRSRRLVELARLQTLNIPRHEYQGVNREERSRALNGMSPTVAYEMLVSHSPPVFSHSPPNSFFADYAPLRLSSEMFSKGGGGYRSTSPSLLPFTRKNGFIQIQASPKRPILINKEEKQSEDDAITKLKKKVVFADDKGMCLTQVRIMSEPSNVPPLWSCQFLAEVTQGISAQPEAESEPWEVKFSQPASDYVEFRKRLDVNKVSLENVIVKEGEETIMGTVKVSNISYNKEVIVRSSTNNWKTSEDANCNYVPNSNGSAPVYVLYDTFSFKITIPPRSRKIEFCVCFRVGDTEYWDNNNGGNYVICKKGHPASVQRSFSCNDLYKKQENKANRGRGPASDVKEVKVDSWSEFASWTHLDNSRPYW